VTYSLKTDPIQIFPLAGSVSTAGDNVLLTPPSNQRLRVYYVSFGADAGNSSAVTFSFRIGAGPVLYQHSLAPGAIYARNIGAARGAGFAAGNVNDQAILALSNGMLVNWNVESDSV
jgi:hypothetical protein